MRQHITHLSKADLIYKFDKQIEEEIAKDQTSNGHGEAFEGKWLGDELIIWDTHFAWENKLHAKLSFIEAEGGSIVEITYKHREGMGIKVGLTFTALALICYSLYGIDLALALMCFVGGWVYELYKQDQRRKPVEEYVKQTIAL